MFVSKSSCCDYVCFKVILQLLRLFQSHLVVIMFVLKSSCSDCLFQSYLVVIMFVSKSSCCDCLFQSHLVVITFVSKSSCCDYVCFKVILL